MPPSSAPRSATSDTIESFLLKVLLYGIGFGASILISRGLGPSGRGIYYLPIVTAATVASFATLGLEQANVFLFGSRSVPLARLWGQGGLVALALGALGGAPAPLRTGASPGNVWKRTGPPLGPGRRRTAPHAALPVRVRPPDAPRRGHVAVSRGSHRRRAADDRVVCAFRRRLVHALRCRRRIGRVEPHRLGARRHSDRAARDNGFAGILRCSRRPSQRSLVLHAAMVLLFLHLRVDMFMLNDMAGTSTLGIYSLSVTLAETVMLGTDSVAIAILPRQMGNSLEEAALMALRAARMAALISAAFIAAWAVVGFPLIVLAFGRAFAGSYCRCWYCCPAWRSWACSACVAAPSSGPGVRAASYGSTS